MFGRKSNERHEKWGKPEMKLNTKIVIGALTGVLLSADNPLATASNV